MSLSGGWTPEQREAASRVEGGGILPPEWVAHVQRVMRNQIRVAGITDGFGGISRWERFVEGLRWRGNSVAERWECWDAVQGRWRRYWRRNGSLPRWAVD